MVAMATSIDTFIGTLSFFGRLSDELTREVIPPRDYRVRVPGVSVPSLAEAQYKSDGFFCFQDLKVSATGYQLEMTSPLYQPRSFLKTLPTSAPVELTYGGEDEVYVLIKTVNGGGKTVGFDKIPFLTPVPKGTPVIGEGGFATTVRETLEGVDVATASLESVAGLLPGQLLRMVRSRSLLAKPGPYYPFPSSSPWRRSRRWARWWTAWRSRPSPCPVRRRSSWAPVATWRHVRMRAGRPCSSSPGIGPSLPVWWP